MPIKRITASMTSAKMIESDAPTVIGVQNARRSPLKIRRPRPPCPMIAATVTMTNGGHGGDANSGDDVRNRERQVDGPACDAAGFIPMPSAASRTDGGIAWNPATMLVTMISRV